MLKVNTSILSELIQFPRETLDVEHKQWMDIGEKEHQATIAKELIALANFGGGHLIIGFAEAEDGSLFEDTLNRPDNLDLWSQDRITGIVDRYASLCFDIALTHVSHPVTKSTFPAILVAGGHRVPIRATRGSPDNKTLVKDRVYVRRPGPKSEEPQSSEEWDRLFERCIQQRQSELATMFRTILDGQLPIEKSQSEVSSKSAAEAFAKVANEKWKHLICELPAEDSARMTRGSYDLVFFVQDTVSAASNTELRNEIEQRVTNHSGWPAFLTVNRSPFKPKLVDGAIQSWFPTEEDSYAFTGPQYNDFWRVSSEGFLFLKRGFPEDGSERLEPGTSFDPSVQVVRLADAVYQAANIAEYLGGSNATLSCQLSYVGLSGRKLVSLSGYGSYSYDRISNQNQISTSKEIEISSLPRMLPETVFELLAPVCELFDFYHLNKPSVEHHIQKYLSRTF